MKQIDEIIEDYTDDTELRELLKEYFSYDIKYSLQILNRIAYNDNKKKALIRRCLCENNFKRFYEPATAILCKRPVK